jgi:hypothetical protein
MIKHFVRLLPPSVTTLIDVARSLVEVCMWRVTVDCHLCFQDDNVGQGTMHFFKTVVCSTYTCPSRQVGFQHLRDVYPSCGYMSESLLPGRKQDTGRKESCATFEKTKMGSGVNYVSGLICSLDIRSVFLRDQLRLFIFFTCLRKTAFPFSFF